MTRTSTILLENGTSVALPAPGLKQMLRPNGTIEPYWVAPGKAVARGYRPKSVKLDRPRDPAEAELLAMRCRDYSLQAASWLDDPDRSHEYIYNGTIGSLVKLYLTHPDSPYRELAENSQTTYGDQLAVVENSVGERRVDRLVPLDTKRWYKGWAEPAQPDGPSRIRRAYGGIQMTRVLFSFGSSLGIPDCARMLEGMSALRFKQPKPREATMDAAAAERFIDVALAHDEVRVALGFACQFELTLRQSDVIGQWHTIKPGDPPGGIRRGRSLWHGLIFEQIDAYGVLRVVSSKTKVATAYDLAAYPMIQRVLALLPKAQRTGPIVVRADGVPMDRWDYARCWRDLATKAGIPEKVWNRDVRASGITEARDAGAAIEDVSKTAGHTSIATTSRIYDRSSVEVSSRVQQQRLAARDKPKPKTS